MKIMKRVLFLCVSFLILFAAFLTSCNTESKKQLGIATYSVKGLESDIEGSFKALSDAGYTVMEISNYNLAEGKVAGYSPAEYSALAEKYGLDIISSHVGGGVDVSDPEGTLSAWSKVFDDHKAMGCRYVVLPMYFWANTPEVLKEQCSLMNRIGEEANKRGLKFGYHNHSIEFALVPGTDQMYWDFLLANTDPEKVFFQMDVFWAKFGGQDPVEQLRKYPDRIKVLHIKDDYIIGKSGNIDFESIFGQFYKNGNKDWFVEMEEEMTPEQKERTAQMMDMLKNIMLSGGPNPFAPRPQTDQQEGEEQAPFPMPAQQDPAVIAQQLKTSLEGIKASAEYLLNSDFVK